MPRLHEEAGSTSAGCALVVRSIRAPALVEPASSCKRDITFEKAFIVVSDPFYAILNLICSTMLRSETIALALLNGQSRIWTCSENLAARTEPNYSWPCVHLAQVCQDTRHQRYVKPAWSGQGRPATAECWRLYRRDSTLLAAHEARATFR